MMKKILLCWLLLVTSNFGYTQEPWQYLDNLKIIEQEIAAVVNDMYLYLGWGDDDKAVLADASIKSVAALDELKDNLEKLNLSDKFAEIELLDLKIINNLREIYNGIEKKDLDDVQEDFNEFRALYTREKNLFKRLSAKDSVKITLPDNFNPQDEALKYIKAADKAAYQTALAKMEEKDYLSAFDILHALKPKYLNTPFESCILLRISDCLLISDTNIPLETIQNEEMPGLNELTRIVNSEEYSPVIYEAYKKWRTVYQEYHHGMSNMSQIPNKMYNDKRWEIIARLNEYFKQNPDEKWSRAQSELLLNEPNILRGGPMGNDNLRYWGMLYADSSIK